MLVGSERHATTAPKDKVNYDCLSGPRGLDQRGIGIDRCPISRKVFRREKQLDDADKSGIRRFPPTPSPESPVLAC
jgi:hypothetical protein